MVVVGGVGCPVVVGFGNHWSGWFGLFRMMQMVLQMVLQMVQWMQTVPQDEV